MWWEITRCLLSEVAELQSGRAEPYALIWVRPCMETMPRVPARLANTIWKQRDCMRSLDFFHDRVVDWRRPSVKPGKCPAPRSRRIWPKPLNSFAAVDRRPHRLLAWLDSQAKPSFRHKTETWQLPTYFLGGEVMGHGSGRNCGDETLIFFLGLTQLVPLYYDAFLYIMMHSSKLWCTPLYHNVHLYIMMLLWFTGYPTQPNNVTIQL